MDSDNVDSGDLTPRERAHIRRRDRKRVTTMVVDNAGIKRVRQALAERRAASGRAPRTPN